MELWTQWYGSFCIHANNKIFHRNETNQEYELVQNIVQYESDLGRSLYETDYNRYNVTFTILFYESSPNVN